LETACAILGYAGVMRLLRLDLVLLPEKRMVSAITNFNFHSLIKNEAKQNTRVERFIRQQK